MNLAARLTALEREGLITRLTPSVGADRGAQTADRVAGELARLQERST